MLQRLNLMKWSSLDTPTRIRLRTTLSATADYGLNVLILFAYAWIGTIGVNVPLIILVVAVVFNAIFLGAIASGLTLRLRDPSITGAQVTAACGINLLGLLLAPQVAYMFIVNLFVPLSFGSLHFSRRGFLLAWLLVALTLTAELAFLNNAVDIALSTPAEKWLHRAVLALAFGRFLAINAEVSRLRARLHRKNKELAQASMQLAEMATHDEMTGVWNRRKFLELLQDEIDRTRRTGSPVCAALADVDRFAQINQRFGHDVGDMVLETLAQLLEGALRSADRIARYGGEEFALLLVDVKPEAVPMMVERLRRLVAEYDWSAIAPGLSVSVSIGAALWHPDDTHLRLINRIAAALNKAKNAGRDRVELAQD
ncbi:MAG: GGDEF domain-containing protein [Burkholderiaceae bacterium]